MQPSRGRRNGTECWRSTVRRCVLAIVVIAGLAACAASLFVEVAPRNLAPYIARRAVGHNPAIVYVGNRLARLLNSLDRGAALPFDMAPLTIGAQRKSAARAGSGDILVFSSDQARTEIARAKPGAVIVFAPGRYRFEQRSIVASQSGTAAAPIVVRALQPGTVQLDLDMVEGFKVLAPYWRFENLAITGICADHSACEHAFHVVGGADHFTAINNTISNFNAHFKINGVDGRYPDDGLIDGNSLRNTGPRDTGNPVTPIDLVGSSGWTISRNLISDFVKSGGNQVSYGVFVKGAGSHNSIERNIIICEQYVQGQPGQRIGLSFGGGGTDKQACRDRQCITEQSASKMVGNLVSACSDVGIYLNSASESRILHNSLIDTAGIDVRFPTSSALIEGNLVDGAIRSRNGALVRANDNLATPTAQVYIGRHPQRALYRAPARGDFGWTDRAARRAPGSAAPFDLCGTLRPVAPAYGAFEDFSSCQASVR